VVAADQAASPKEIPMRKQFKRPAKNRSPKLASKEARRMKRERSTPAATDAGKKKGAASKQFRVIAMLQSPGGTTIADLMQETGWQQHSVRGFLAGVVRRKLKLNLQSNKLDGDRVYRIEAGDPKVGHRKSGRPEA
jgi:hypothetical protein